ncbi:hypothetical protein [Marinobacterium iners]|uniref:Uncharacterized protein n=1 Tax=Marinobacterium iners DSM 11526 TaxID=1122198 RepID=A0A1H3ZY78_9GAMM|nr:hypothetical protein [Marinobacterium iners]SEA28598.1 hypothetical protein SAMN02745729_102208 [Marinobacterium iners DSM 11526]
MDDEFEFFSKQENRTVLNSFRTRLDMYSESDEFAKTRNSYIRLVVNAISRNPKEWDRNCEINISWMGEHFIDEISGDIDFSDKNKMDIIFSICFRLVFEYYLSVKNELSNDFNRLKDFALNNIGFFSDDARFQIDYAFRDMPVAIFKDIANSESIQSIRNLHQVSEYVKNTIDKFSKELAAKEKRVSDLQESLSKYESAFNFVGLYEGFDELSKEKKKEKLNLFRALLASGFFCLLPFLCEVLFIYKNWINLDIYIKAVALSFIPMISIVAISIYFFRVILHSYKGVRAQLLQIEIRKTLCRFIQNYNEYSFDLKSRNSAALEKFENIIFAPIVSDEENLPSAFDGLEQLGKIFQSVKKGG